MDDNFAKLGKKLHCTGLTIFKYERKRIFKGFRNSACPETYAHTVAYPTSYEFMRSTRVLMPFIFALSHPFTAFCHTLRLTRA